MRCLKPRPVGFKSDGKTISWSEKNFDKQYATFQLPCGKCLECRLEYARSAAIRCVHESKVHEQNSFITLTYSDQNLKSPKLNYLDFQLFMKRLRHERFTTLLKTNGLSRKDWEHLPKPERDKLYEPISVGAFITGEYGDRTKRPHWHALLFNWRPSDCEYLRTTDRGDRLYKSATLDNLWGKNDTSVKPNEIGDVTFESAGYCARYAAKKLIHGNDQDHDYHPIHKRSSKHAIGKRYLEKYWPDIFNYGYVVLDNGQKASIPRYYEKWLMKHHPDKWMSYVTKTKADKIEKAEQIELQQNNERWSEELKRVEQHKKPMVTRSKVRQTILESRFKNLQKHLKGDL